MKRIFFDTEFTDLAIDAKLISIGFVADKGETFYAELSGTYSLADCSDFTLENVIPHLNGGGSIIDMSTLSEKLRSWIESLGVQTQLATDSLVWDWPWIKEIFSLSGWPKNLNQKPIYCYDLAGVDQLEEKIDEVFGLHPEFCRHHALNDAIVNQMAISEINASRAQYKP